jgi:hypothetical protein
VLTLEAGGGRVLVRGGFLLRRIWIRLLVALVVFSFLAALAALFGVI